MNDFEKLKVYATLTNTLDKYVYLRKDEKGTYIEYAFLEGAPHDNRCLSWYDSYQENAYIRNEWVAGLSDEDKRARLDVIKKKRDSRVGQLFRLSSFTCGYEEYLERQLEESKKSWEKYHPDEPFVPEDHICKVGKPAPKCVKNKTCSHWTYNEPVKCACWVLVDVDNIDQVPIPIDVAVELFDKILELKEDKS